MEGNVTGEQSDLGPIRLGPYCLQYKLHKSYVRTSTD